MTIPSKAKTPFRDGDQTFVLHTYESKNVFFKTENTNYKPHKFLWSRPCGAIYLVRNLKAAKCDKVSMPMTTLPDESQGFEALDVIYTLIKVMDCVIDYFQDPSAFHLVPEGPIFFLFVTATEVLMVLCEDGDPPQSN